MREASKSHNLWFEDISDVFRSERDQVYLDYTHLTSKGALLVAERLGRVVEGVSLGAEVALRKEP